MMLESFQTRGGPNPLNSPADGGFRIQEKVPKGVEMRRLLNEVGQLEVY